VEAMKMELIACHWRSSGSDRLIGFWFWKDIRENHNYIKHFGMKRPNELGLYDFSRNMEERCLDAKYCCEILLRGNL